MLIEEELKSLRSTGSSARRNFSTLEQESGSVTQRAGKMWSWDSQEPAPAARPGAGRVPGPLHSRISSGRNSD